LLAGLEANVTTQARFDLKSDWPIIAGFSDTLTLPIETTGSATAGLPGDGGGLSPMASELVIQPPVPMDSARPAPAAAVIPQGAEDYVAKRVEQYAGWYDKKCGPLKQQHLRIKAVTVIGGALVPVLVNANFDFLRLGVDVAKVGATLLSLLVVILVSWDSVFQYGKQWKNYRSTEQFLRQEAYLFKYRAGFYAEMDEAKAFKIFVERVEGAIAQENSVTLDTLTREGNGGRPGTREG
jgi:hypothetical protein